MKKLDKTNKPFLLIICANSFFFLFYDCSTNCK
nr:MAG TPA: coiled-coil domain-containing protein [Caudoviricetes sp.]